MGDIAGTIEGVPFFEVNEPAQRNFTNYVETLNDPMIINGKDLDIIFQFTSAAALTGQINMIATVYATAPKGADLNGKIEGPVYALADTQPVITWSLDPTFGE